MMKKFQTFFVMFLYESEASRLQKKQWFLPWKQERYLKKGIFLHSAECLTACKI